MLELLICSNEKVESFAVIERKGKEKILARFTCIRRVMG